MSKLIYNNSTLISFAAITAQEIAEKANMNQCTLQYQVNKSYYTKYTIHQSSYHIFQTSKAENSMNRLKGKELLYNHTAFSIIIEQLIAEPLLLIISYTTTHYDTLVSSGKYNSKNLTIIIECYIYNIYIIYNLQEREEGRREVPSVTRKVKEIFH